MTIILAQILVNCNKKRKRKKKNIRKLYYKTRKNNQVSPRIFCENVVTESGELDNNAGAAKNRAIRKE